MGCTTSCIAPSVAELNKSVKVGDERMILLKLAACPKLLSTTTSVLSSAGLTPVHQACESKQVKVVEQILSFMSCSSLETVREALMPYCRRVGRQLPSSVVEGVRLVVDMANSKGQTPLMYACFSDCPEIVKLLLAQGADPWVGDRCGRRTALHYAAMGGSSACIQALLKHISPRLLTRQGVRYVDARSLCGLTPLHYCVYYGNLEALRELLHHFDPQINAATTSESYDVSVTCEARSAPLHFAAVTGNEEAAREVLRYYAQHRGNRAVADPRTRSNAAGQLPWQVALSHHPAALSMASLLHPGQPLERLLEAGTGPHGAPGAGLGLGPPPLVAIAAAALRTKLLSEVRDIRDQHQPDKTVRVREGAVSNEAEVGGKEAAGRTEEGGGDAAAAASIARGEFEAATALAACTDTAAAAVRVGTSVCCGSSTCGERSGRRMGQYRAGRGRRSASVAPLPDCCSRCTQDATTRAAPQAAAATAAVATSAISCYSSCGPVEGGQSQSRVACGAGHPRGPPVGEEGQACGPAASTAAPAPAAMQEVKEEGDDDDDDDDDDDKEDLDCGVCFAARVSVSPAGCSHGLCTECAEQLCGGVTRRPLQCPFCRRVVTGFVKLRSKPQPH